MDVDPIVLLVQMHIHIDYIDTFCSFHCQDFEKIFQSILELKLDYSFQ